MEEKEVNYHKKKKKVDRPYQIESRYKKHVSHTNGNGRTYWTLSNEWQEWKDSYKKFAKETDAIAWVKKENSHHAGYKPMAEFRIKVKE